MTLTGSQVREARELLGWSRTKLAAKCLLSESTIRNAEAREFVKDTNTFAIKSVLDRAGIIIVDGERVTLRNGDNTPTGARVYVARKALGWTQRDLAEKAGVSVAEVAGFERSSDRTSQLGVRLRDALAGGGARFESVAALRGADELTINGAQCQAARKVLGWSRPELSLRSGLGAQIIWEFERGRRPISTRASNMLRQTLEGAGIVFGADSTRLRGGR
jgi:transcriptional regulator with XRE-family HTH domain